MICPVGQRREAANPASFVRKLNALSRNTRNNGISQAPYTNKVPPESVTRACTPGRVATTSAIPDNGIRLNAVDSASASVAVGAMTLTVL